MLRGTQINVNAFQLIFFVSSQGQGGSLCYFIVPLPKCMICQMICA